MCRRGHHNVQVFVISRKNASCKIAVCSFEPLGEWQLTSRAHLSCCYHIKRTSRRHTQQSIWQCVHSIVVQVIAQNRHDCLWLSSLNVVNENITFFTSLPLKKVPSSIRAWRDLWFNQTLTKVKPPLGIGHPPLHEKHPPPMESATPLAVVDGDGGQISSLSWLARNNFLGFSPGKFKSGWSTKAKRNSEDERISLTVLVNSCRKFCKNRTLSFVDDYDVVADCAAGSIVIQVNHIYSHNTGGLKEISEPVLWFLWCWRSSTWTTRGPSEDICFWS